MPQRVRTSQLQPLGHVSRPRAVSRPFCSAIKSRNPELFAARPGVKCHSEPAPTDARGNTTPAMLAANARSAPGP